MADYLYRCFDLVSGTVLTDLPLAVSSLPRNLSGDADTQPTLDLSSGGIDADGNLQGISKLSPYDSTIPGRTGLFALRDGQPVWGGIIWAREYDSATKQLTITASTVESYWRHRYFAKAVTYTNVDQFTIARQLMDTGVAVGTSNLFLSVDGFSVVTFVITSETITLGDGTVVEIAPSIGVNLFDPALTSGVLRTLTYQPGKCLYDAISELANAAGGIDYTCDPIVNLDGTLGWNVRIASPQLGRAQTDTRFAFSYGQPGSTITAYKYAEDSRSAANREVDTGQELNGAIPVAVITAINPLLVGYPLIEATTAYPDTVDPTVLQDRAQNPLASGATELATSAYTVRVDDGEVPFGGYSLGDQAIFGVTDELTPPQADGKAGRYSVERIVGWDLRPDARGQLEQVALVTNPTVQASRRFPPTLKKRLDDVARQLGSIASTSKVGAGSFGVTVTDQLYTTVPNSTSGSPGASVYLTYLVFTVQSPVLSLLVTADKTGVSGTLRLSLVDANTGFTALLAGIVPITSAAAANASPTAFNVDVSSYAPGTLAVIQVTCQMDAAAATNTTSARIFYAGNQHS